MNFVGCAAFLAHNTRSTLEADILKAHEETKMASRHLSVHLSPLLLPSLSFSPGRRETAMDTSLPDNGWSFKTREPIFAFVSRPSHTPLHLAPLDNVADKVARNVAAVFHSAHE